MDDVRQDCDLPREYLGLGLQDAFGVLLERHIGLVYPAARRRVGNADRCFGLNGSNRRIRRQIRCTPLKTHPHDFRPERPRRCRGSFFAKVHIDLQPALN